MTRCPDLKISRYPGDQITSSPDTSLSTSRLAIKKRRSKMGIEHEENLPFPSLFPCHNFSPNVTVTVEHQRSPPSFALQQFKFPLRTVLFASFAPLRSLRGPNCRSLR